MHLLNQPQESLVSDTIKACGYMALNFQFLNSDVSLLVLQALTRLLDKLPNHSEQRDTCIGAVSNLLKVRSQNCVFFIKNDGPSKLMNCLL